MFYIILLTPIVLSIIAFLLNKKKSISFLKYSTLIYFILFLFEVFLLKIWYSYDLAIFHINYNINFEHITNISSLLVLLVGILAFLIFWYSIYYFKKEIEHKTVWLNRIKEYNILVNLFIFAMLFVLNTNNILVMWIALELTTIFTTFLISFYWTSTSWEASWKYVLLCSVWLTIWLFWIILLIVSWLDSLNFLNITFEHINVLLTKLSFAFIVVWFWTKVWLFPMNSWLPDAHWKASTPVSAFMSAILLPIALYVIYKLKIIVDLMLWESTFTNNILLGFWLITLLYSWFIMIFQRHFKRALAYSSSENMWLLTIAIWIWTPIAFKLWILHLIAHSFFKSSSFMSVWNVLLEQKTGQFSKISDLFKNQKITSIIMIFSLAMLVWIPISPLFISEIWMLYVLFIKNMYLSFLLIFSLVLVFSWLLLNFWKLFKKQWKEESKKIDEKLTLNSIFTPIILTIILGLLSIISVIYIF